MRIESDDGARWPSGEKLPKSFNQALASGWRIGRVSGGGSDIQLRIHKTVGRLHLRLTVPYKLVDRYGRPRSPRVTRRGSR